MTKKDEKGNYLLDTIERNALEDEVKMGRKVAVVIVVLLTVYLFSRLFL